MTRSAIESVMDETGEALIVVSSDAGEALGSIFGMPEVRLDDTSDDEVLSFLYPGIVRQFFALRDRWYVERGPISALSEIVGCPSYRQIIGMGRRAVPLILNQLRQEGDDPDYWFTALEAITGADPVAESDYGDMVAMARSWRDWADRNYV